jgi:hypothetical protein
MMECTPENYPTLCTLWCTNMGCNFGLYPHSDLRLNIVQRSMSLYHTVCHYVTFLSYAKKEWRFFCNLHAHMMNPAFAQTAWLSKHRQDATCISRLLSSSSPSWQVAFCLCWLTSEWSILSKGDVNVLADSKVLVLNFMHCFQTGESAAADNIEWFIGNPSFSRSNYLAPPPPRSLPLPSVSSTGDTQEDWKRATACWLETGGRGRLTSQIIRPQKA